MRPNSPALSFSIWGSLGFWLLIAQLRPVQQLPPITFNKNFECGSLGKIEQSGEGQYRCFVEGQCDERGHNRQANWYYFRIDGIKDRNISLTLTDLVGEYNSTPGAVPMNADTIPVYSFDNEHWLHFPGMLWDDQKKEATLQFRFDRDSIWIAHLPPYTYTTLRNLLENLAKAPSLRTEVIGITARGRELYLLTVTNFDRPDAAKKTVWLQARQHAWETGTSFVMEGALRFITSDNPKARSLRDRVVFKFTPMVDPDGSATGRVRFNANGYDVNRHWDEVDLRSKEIMQKMPEIWYVKKALYAYVDSGRHIDLALNLHNEESGEYMETQVDDPAILNTIRNLDREVAAKTTFDPSRQLQIPNKPNNSFNFLWNERRIPAILMEQRISTSKKLGRHPTVQDRLDFGKQLVQALAEVALKDQTRN